MQASWWAILLTIASTFSGAAGALLVKQGAKKFTLSLNQIKNIRLIFGLFLYGFSSVLFIIALKGGDLSVLYPVVSVGYIWVSIISIKVLNEKMNLSKWLGIFLIILGVSSIGFA